jgi:dTDP-glucose pyrophosphorylase
VITNFSAMTVLESATLRDAIAAIDAGGRQLAIVLGAGGHLIGTISDGDIRRGLLRGVSLDATVADVVNTSPTVASVSSSMSDVIDDPDSSNIHIVPVVDDAGIVVGLLAENEEAVIEPLSTPVVLMAGGKGIRLHPLTFNVPKPMLTVGETPILEIILRKLHAQGFRKIYISVNYLAEIIENHVGDGSWLGLDVTYIHEEKPMGTAGALAQMDQFLAEPFLVMNGDLLTNCDLSDVVRSHTKSGAEATLCVREYSFQIPYGVVNVEGDTVQSISEKPTHSSLVSAGIYVLNPTTIDLVPKNSYFDMPSLLTAISDSGSPVVAFPVFEPWLDIGRHDDLEDARSNVSDWLNGTNLRK